MKLITPECTGKYIWLYKPNEKFEPVYSVTCIREKTPAWEKLIGNMKELLEQYYDDECKRTRKKLTRSTQLPWKEEEDGTLTFLVKNKATGTKKDGTTFSCKPSVLGPDRQDLKEEELAGTLGNGTLLRCGFTANLWNQKEVGISARLNFCQIIKPKYRVSYDDYRGVDGSSLQTYERDNSLFKKSERMTTDRSVPAKVFIEEIEEDGIEVDDLTRRLRQG